jgi:hypothetical protein
MSLTNDRPKPSSQSELSGGALVVASSVLKAVVPAVIGSAPLHSSFASCGMTLKDTEPVPAES